MVVLDLVEDVSSAWSPATGVVAEPSRLAVDTRGHVHGFGVDADLLAGDPRNRLVAASPFSNVQRNHQLARSFVAWLVRRSGITLSGGIPVFLPLPAGSQQTDRAFLPEVVSEMGGDPLVIHRPLAAAMALGLQVDEPVCHLMAEVSESHVDMAVVRAGTVLLSERVLRDDGAAIGAVTRQSLGALDPDDELDIRADGVHLYGWAAPRYAAQTLDAIGLSLAAPVGTGPTVLTGARLMAEEVLPWLMADGGTGSRSRFTRLR